jgi:large exoprotein involved in heme utilization and adhesion
MNKNTVQTSNSGRQQSGNIIIQADSLNLNQESNITTSIGGSGSGGKITVNADAISLSNRSTILAQTLGPRGGKAGDVEINTNSLTATQGSQISSSTGGVGDAGNVSVIATDSITLSGNSKENPSGIFSFVSTDLPGFIPAFLFPMGMRRGNGNAGIVTIETGSLLINNGAQVKTTTFGTGNAGIININADAIFLDGAVLAPPGSPQPTITSGILSEIAPGSKGKGREININTGQLSVTNGAFISASTVSKGDAGDINIVASESVSFDGFPGEPFFHSGAYVETKKGATGNAGTLTIITPSLSVTNGATLRALTEGSGDAGSIFVNASKSIFLSGVDTGIFSNTTSDSSGKGGSIFIDPERVEINNGAAISVDSKGSGIGGNISIEADQLRLDNGRISAQTVRSDGGDIKLAVSNLLFLRRGSLISTTAGTEKAGGNGGNMVITAGFIVAVPGENSDITANAFLGDGGNIDVTTQGLFNIAFRPQLTPLNDITVSSEFGLVGDVTFKGLKLDPSSGLVKLPDNLADSSNQIIVGCAAARGNSFTITGRGGLPEDPTGTIRGQTLLSDLRDFSSLTEGTNNTPENNQVLVKSPPSQIVEATSWVKDKEGNITLVAARQNENPTTYRPSNCH